jgi:hypothetical protein
MHGRFFVRWLQIKGRVQNDTTPIFRKVRDLEEWPYLRLHQFSRCACIYCIFGHLDDVWIQIWIVDIQIHFKHWGGIPALRCGTQKPCMSNWSAPCTLAHSTPTADLTYISSERAGCRTAPLQFSKVRDLEQWPYLRLHQFSWCACIYCIFGHLDDVWIQILTVGTSNTLQSFSWKYPPHYMEPRNHACHTGVHHPPWHTQTPLPTW